MESSMGSLMGSLGGGRCSPVQAQFAAAGLGPVRPIRQRAFANGCAASVQTALARARQAVQT